jgi:hypothetical protein
MKWIVKTVHHFGNQSFANPLVGLLDGFCRCLPYMLAETKTKLNFTSLKNKKYDSGC